jgi:cytochrome c
VLAQGALPRYTPSLTAELKARLARADLDAGAQFFERKCSQCHDAARDGDNGRCPLLWNVFGRKSATIPGFLFSDAMKQAGVTWDYATLDYYLADTERAVPGRAMNFVGIPDAQLRANVIAYLRKINDNPPPLPQ